MVEQRTENPCVGGSIPPRGTIRFAFCFRKSLTYGLWCFRTSNHFIFLEPNVLSEQSESKGRTLSNMKIFIDDQRTPPDDSWIVVRDLEELKLVLEKATTDGENIEIISFDHDLGQDQNEVDKLDGYYIVKWLSEHYPHLIVGETEHIIHSANAVGRENIESYLEFCKNNKERLLASKEEEDPFPEMRMPR